MSQQPKGQLVSIDYTLETNFSNEDLARIQATGSKIVVAKPSDGGTPSVAWIAFHPSQCNSMEWSEEYGIYASRAALQHGALLTHISRTTIPTQDAKVYEFADGYFRPPTPGGQPGSFYALNSSENDSKYLTFGLYQNASVNGQTMKGNAISAASVLYRSTAQMTPYTTIYLWVQSEVESNTVLTVVTSPMTKVRFGSDATKFSLDYYPAKGTFIPGGSAELPPGIALEHHDPMAGLIAA
jgi:hypothetical protein